MLPYLQPFYLQWRFTFLNAVKKDLNLFISAAEAAGLNNEGLQGLAQLLERSKPAGLDGLDYCALHVLTAEQTAAAAPE